MNPFPTGWSPAGWFPTRLLGLFRLLFFFGCRARQVPFGELRMWGPHFGIIHVIHAVRFEIADNLAFFTAVEPVPVRFVKSVLSALEPSALPKLVIVVVQWLVHVGVSCPGRHEANVCKENVATA